MYGVFFEATIRKKTGTEGIENVKELFIKSSECFAIEHLNWQMAHSTHLTMSMENLCELHKEIADN